MRRRQVDRKIEALRAIPGLGGCPSRELRELGRVTDELVLDEGAVLVREGCSGRGGWMLVEGAVAGEAGGTERWRAGAGSFVGDLGVFGASPAPLTLRAATRVRAFAVEPRAADVLFGLPTVSRWLFAQLDLRLRSLLAPPAGADPAPFRRAPLAASARLALGAAVG